MEELSESKKTKPVVYAMCGLQCSGKSTYAKTLAEKTGAKILSSDAIRNKNPDWENAKVFGYLYQRANNLLNKGESIIIDATNITIKTRKQLLQAIKDPNIERQCHILNTPIEVCEERLSERNASDYEIKIPPAALQKYLKLFEVPFYQEGWDLIKVVTPPDDKASIRAQLDILRQSQGYDQKNSHHTQDLYEHMITTQNNIKELVPSDKDYSKQAMLATAAMYHDIGKLFTRTYKEGNPDAHYYQHANVGAYYILCHCGIYSYPLGREPYYLTQPTLDWVFYINYHMTLYNIKTEKAEAKWRKIFGDTAYDNLVLLNIADKTHPEKGEENNEA